jgi:uncharacterized glyoxalase superfamily protein PhnB
MVTEENDMTDLSQPVLGGVAPYLFVSDAAAAAAFYAKAFGATEVARAPADPQGRLIHVHLVINGGSVMLSDPFPEHGSPLKEPQAFMLHLQVDGIDAAFQRAVDAGAEVTLPVQLMFWGDRYGQLRDPFGVAWSMGESQKKG